MEKIHFIMKHDERQESLMVRWTYTNISKHLLSPDINQALFQVPFTYQLSTALLLIIQSCQRQREGVGGLGAALGSCCSSVGEQSGWQTPPSAHSQTCSWAPMYALGEQQWPQQCAQQWRKHRVKASFAILQRSWNARFQTPYRFPGEPVGQLQWWPPERPLGSAASRAQGQEGGTKGFSWWGRMDADIAAWGCYVRRQICYLTGDKSHKAGEASPQGLHVTLETNIYKALRDCDSLRTVRLL